MSRDLDVLLYFLRKDLSKVSDLNKFEVFKTNIDLNNLTLKNLLKYFCIRCSKNTGETQLFVGLRHEELHDAF